MNIKKLIASLALVLILFVSVSAATLAWLSIGSHTEKPTNVSGSVLGGFFESGVGTKDSPYIITQPIHVYNLAWLQYLGEFNQSEQINENGKREITPTYFKIGDSVPQSGIDMQGLVIPPIGTKEYPFFGNFNGNGKLIHNFTVSNNLGGDGGIQRRPSQVTTLEGVEVTDERNAAIVGFFGVVGEFEGADFTLVNGGLDPDDGTTIVNSIYDLVLDNFTVRTENDESIIGLLAGYVNGTISNVGIGLGNISISNNVVPLQISSLNGDTTQDALKAISLFSLVGACDTEVIWAGLPTDSLGDGGQGDSSGWGGSIGIDKLYDMLVNIRGTKDNSNPGDNLSMSDYAYQAVKVQSESGEYFCGINPTTVGGIMYSDNYGIKDQHSVVYADGNTASDNLTVLSGGAWITNTIICKEKDNTSVDAQYIKCNDSSYLAVEVSGGAPTIKIVENEASAAKWVIGADKSLYVITNGIKLYVNATGENIIFSNSATSKNWSFVESKGLCYTEDGTAHYLKLVDGKWVLRAESNTASYYVIKSGSNYLTVSENIHPSGVRIVSNYVASSDLDPGITKWYISEIPNSPYYNVYTTVDSTPNCVLLYLNMFVANSQAYGQIPWELKGEKLYYPNNFPPGYVSYNSSTEMWGIDSNENNAASLVAVTPDTGETDTVAWSSVATTAKEIEYTSTNTATYEYGVANKYDATYIPLRKNDGLNTTHRDNTGYITGGMYDQLREGNPPMIGRQFDVWVSRFPIASIQDDGNVYVWDGENDKFSQVSTDPSAFTEDSLGASLNKYAGTDGEPGSVDAYKELLKADKLYGLQFLNGCISMDSLVTIPTAYINGNAPFSNYKVPGDCIDFNLAKNGYINFFAGTYYPGTNSFFSLHHIVRDSNQNITAIREIKLIYEYGSKGSQTEYVYEYYVEEEGQSKYSLDSFTDEMAASSRIAFNTELLTNPSVETGFIADSNSNYDEWNEPVGGYKGKAYYFEIPVVAGEYALGSVEGKTGACLLYLDIGANAAGSDDDGTGDGEGDKAEHTITGVNFITAENVQNSFAADGIPSWSTYPVIVARLSTEAAGETCGGTVAFERQDALSISYGTSSDTVFEVTYFYETDQGSVTISSTLTPIPKKRPGDEGQ